MMNKNDLIVVAGGGDIFQLYGHNIDVRMNWSDGWKNSPETKPSIDFVKSFGAQGLAVPTGAEPIYLDFAAGANNTVPTNGP